MAERPEEQKGVKASLSLPVCTSGAGRGTGGWEREKKREREMLLFLSLRSENILSRTFLYIFRLANAQKLFIH